LSLYDQLGGAVGVSAVVSEFIANVAADSNVNWMFADTDIVNLQMMLENQICEATGGGCTYTGGSMLDVHADMAITDAQFMFVVSDLLAALDTLGVPYTASTFDGGLPADQLIGALAAMQTDIVTDAAGDTVAFNQLGGRAAVEAVVDEFIAVVGADSRINGFFATSDLDALNGLLVEQICEATGGYCTYSGRSMCETHDGMGVSESDFDALVGDLLAALDTLGVPYALDGSAVIDPLLLALVGMEGEIVDPQVDCP
jgi:hemoglobin